MADSSSSNNSNNDASTGAAAAPVKLNVAAKEFVPSFLSTAATTTATTTAETVPAIAAATTNNNNQRNNRNSGGKNRNNNNHHNNNNSMMQQQQYGNLMYPNAYLQPPGVASPYGYGANPQDIMMFQQLMLQQQGLAVNSAVAAGIPGGTPPFMMPPPGVYLPSTGMPNYLPYVMSPGMIPQQQMPSSSIMNPTAAVADVPAVGDAASTTATDAAATAATEVDQQIETGDSSVAEKAEAVEAATTTTTAAVEEAKSAIVEAESHETQQPKEIAAVETEQATAATATATVKAAVTADKTATKANATPTSTTATATTAAAATTSNSGDVLIYSKRKLIELALPISTPIPEEMSDFYSVEDFETGKENGDKFARAPVGFLAESEKLQLLLQEGHFSNTPPLMRAASSSGNLRSNNNNNNNNNSSSDRRGGGGFDRSDSRNGNSSRNNNNSNFNSRNRDNSSRDFGRNNNREKTDEFDDFYSLDQSGAAVTKEVPGYKSMFQVSENAEDAVKRKANFILNRMSVTNFDRISDELMQLFRDICSSEEKVLRKGIEAIILKAQMEETFCFIYADLCRKLIDQWTDLEPENSSFSSITDAAATTEDAADTAAAATAAAAVGAVERRTMGRIFKEYLLSRCQSEFEFDRVAALDEIRADSSLQADERLEREVLLKKRITGHMRFIGEIYMKDLVKATIMKEQCLDVLIECSEEEELVCMCKLFQTIGAKIEQYYIDKSRQKKNRGKELDKIVSGYFERILDIAKNHEVSRIRFMMQDLYEMRQNNWTKRFEEEAMVNLDEARNGSSSNSNAVAAASISRQGTPQLQLPSPSAPQQQLTTSSMEEDWTQVPSGKKKGTNISSTNLAAMNSGPGSAGGSSGMPRNSSSGSGLNRGSSSNNVSSMDARRGNNSNNSSSLRKQASGNVQKSGSRNNLAAGAGAVVQRSNTPQLSMSAADGSGSGKSSGKSPGWSRGSKGNSNNNSNSNSSGAFEDNRAPPARPATAPLPSGGDWTPAAATARGSSTATTTAAAATARVAAATAAVEEDAEKVAKKTKSTLEEMFHTRSVEEAVECFKELNPAPALLPTVVKDLIFLSVDRSKEEGLELLSELLQQLSTAVVAADAVVEGALLFLDALDELLIDVPKAGLLGAIIFAELCVRGVISFSLLKNIPDENMFSMSPKRAEFTLQILQQVQSRCDSQQAQAMLQNSGLDLLAIIIAPPKETAEDALKALAAKFELLFLLQ